MWSKDIARWLWWIPVALIATGLILCFEPNFSLGKKDITPTAQVEKFYLPPRGEVDAEYDEVPTVDAGPGTIHRLRGDAPYRIISGKPDGTSKIYNMPAGWSTWNGAAPAGKLYLVSGKDAKTKTLVEITRVQ